MKTIVVVNEPFEIVRVVRGLAEKYKEIMIVYDKEGKEVLIKAWRKRKSET